jgi:opacity protein-like surface antigen
MIQPARYLVLAALAGVAAHAAAWDGLSAGLNVGIVRSHAHYQTGPDDTGWFKISGQTASMWREGNRGDADYTGLAGLSLIWGRQSGSFVYGAQLGVNAMRTQLDTTNTRNYSKNTVYTGSESFAYRQSVNATGLYTLAARAGHAFGHSLLSGTAGLGVTRLSPVLTYQDTYTGTAKYTASHRQTKTRAGWAVGLDYQYRLANGLNLKGEYTFIDFGKTSFTTTTLDGAGTDRGTMNFSAKVRMSTFMFGIEKQF